MKNYEVEIYFKGMRACYVYRTFAHSVEEAKEKAVDYIGRFEPILDITKLKAKRIKEARDV